MLSFSVNPQWDSKKAKAVAQIVREMTPQNAEHVSDAFISVMNGLVDGRDKMNLISYSVVIHKREEEKKSKESELVLPLITEDEAEMGVDGVNAASIPDGFDLVAMAEEKETIDEMVEKFLEVREFIFFKKGWDIWRVLCLVRRGDVRAQAHARMIISQMDMRPFFQEFCSDIRNIYGVEAILGQA